jgi:ABC-type branched-subunit amino acid transport system substrate-binding protein
MTARQMAGGVGRRSVITATAVAGLAQLASPFIIAARGETPVRIGMIDPLTGACAALARNEVMGAQLAAARLNASGGVLGRQVELLVEGLANDVGTGVEKARKLIDRGVHVADQEIDMVAARGVNRAHWQRPGAAPGCPRRGSGPSQC